MHRVLRRRAPGATLAVLTLTAATTLTLPTALTSAAAAHSARVPSGFASQSTTWLDAQRGFLLGAAPCGTHTCTYALGTTDGGTTWATLGQVHSPIAQQ